MESSADKLMLPVWRDWFTFPHEQFTAYFRRLRAVPIYDYRSIPLRASFNSNTHYHKHIPPNIKHHRIPAPEMSFTQPNLPTLILEIEAFINEIREQSKVWSRGHPLNSSLNWTSRKFYNLTKTLGIFWGLNFLPRSWNIGRLVFKMILSYLLMYIINPRKRHHGGL